MVKDSCIGYFNLNNPSYSEPKKRIDEHRCPIDEMHKPEEFGEERYFDPVNYQM